MIRFDLLDEYTCVLLPKHSRSGAGKETARSEVSATDRPINVRWGHWMAAAGGFAALAIVAMVSSLSV